jgi:tetratricopeptide (TPR) repeat protein
VAGAADAWCYVLLTQARECLSRDDAERAEGLLVQAMAGFEQIPFLVGVAEARAELASLMHRQGRLLEAIEVVEAGLVVLEAPEVFASIAPYQQSVFTYQLAELRQTGSRICAELGEGSRAIELVRRAVNGLSTLPDRDGLAQARFALAELLTADQPLEATSTYEQALFDAQLDGDLFLELVIRRERAWARKSSDGVDAALADIDDARAAPARPGSGRPAGA